MKPSVKHIIFRNGNIFCYHCGGNKDLEMPISLQDLTKNLDAFNTKHRKCKKTWVEPIAEPQGKTETQNAVWWLANGEQGQSSFTIFNYLSEEIEVPIDFAECHPHDPDDFRRCYLLLKAIPQFRERLYKLKNLSDTWSNLVNNWDELENMLEEQMRTKENNGMYFFMRTLGC